jgi:hypothetical protein
MEREKGGKGTKGRVCEDIRRPEGTSRATVNREDRGSTEIEDRGQGNT